MGRRDFWMRSVMGAAAVCWVGIAIALLTPGCTSHPVPRSPAHVVGVPHSALLGDVMEQDVAMMAALVQEAVEAHAPRLVLRLDTPGGDVDVARRIAYLMDVARDHGVRVDCVVDGHAWSAGFYILQMCDRRFMTKRSVLMTHNPRAVGGPDGGVEADNVQKLMTAETFAWAEGAGARLTTSLEEYRQRTADGRMWTFTWGEALQAHAVDAVIDDPRQLWR